MANLFLTFIVYIVNKKEGKVQRKKYTEKRDKARALNLNSSNMYACRLTEIC
jgi:hypothetical protein